MTDIITDSGASKATAAQALKMTSEEKTQTSGEHYFSDGAERKRLRETDVPKSDAATDNTSVKLHSLVQNSMEDVSLMIGYQCDNACSFFQRVPEILSKLDDILKGNAEIKR